jgi:4-diphosphocytidyl-2-C-methyl-D-erythritol kinase
MKVLSPAKINLGLQVLNKRKDGFHNINTVFYPINIYDEITIEQSDDLIVDTIGMNIDVQDNLVYKAAAKLQKKDGKRLGAKITLKKNIPAGAGLGGGSANAAITLLALKSLWKSDVTNTDLHIISQALGSDVPFFLRHGAAIGLSRGEKLEYIAWQAKHKIVVVNPGIHISTAEAYKALGRDGTMPKTVDFRTILYRSDENPSILNMLFNDFEKYAFQTHPEIAELKRSLYHNGAVLAMMSGSGSSVFAFFDREKDISFLDSLYPNYKVIVEKELNKN